MSEQKMGMSLNGVEIPAGDQIIILNDETNERLIGTMVRQRETENGWIVYVTLSDGKDHMFLADGFDWYRLSDSDIYSIYTFQNGHAIKG